MTVDELIAETAQDDCGQADVCATPPDALREESCSG